VARTVSQVADVAGVSVRTLHHYDRIGLLTPSDRTSAGYRLYTPQDLERLQQVLLFKELGFGLDDIRRIMNEPGFDRIEALAAQRTLLQMKSQRIGDMLGAVEKALDAAEKGIAMDEKDMFEVFGDFDPKQYEDEARERWGQTEAYKESARRVAKMTKEDWIRIKAEGEAIEAGLAQAMAEGKPVDDPEVQALVERHWSQIDSNFYPCSLEVYEGLADMYVADPRFTAHYDERAEGLAAYVHDAMKAWVASRRD
jgi:MerR family transcriptional regulator, thiopeptide resistance regulator